jgi:sRNA-binding regulator protein Hfq
MSKIGVFPPDQDIRQPDGKKETKEASKPKEKKLSAEIDFWTDCIKQKCSLTFRLIDATELKGKLVAYDNYFLLVEAEGKQRLLHKGGLLWAAVD